MENKNKENQKGVCMTVHKIGSIEVFEIDQNIDQYT